MSTGSAAFATALKLVAEEVAGSTSSMSGKDGGSAKLDAALPMTALRVEAAQLCVLESAVRLARRCKRKRLCVRDVERAIEMEFGESPLYFTSASERPLEAHAKPSSHSTTSSSSSSSSSIQVYYDVDVNLKELVDSASEGGGGGLPRVPLAPSYTVHWLAVDGVQPQVPENQSSSSSSSSLPRGGGGGGAAAKPPPPHKQDNAAAAAVMTRELQLYFDKTIQVLLEAEAVGGGAGEPSRRVLAALANDAGIDRLVPHLVAFVFQRVNDLSTSSSSLSLAGLWTCLRVAQALIANESLRNLDLYLHELLPSLLTCVVAQSLSSGGGQQGNNDHWAVRDYAADVVAQLCKKYGEAYAGLQARVCRVYSGALEGDANALTSRYGGVVGLSALGPLVVDSLLVPYLASHAGFIAQLDQAMQVGGGDRAEDDATFVTRVEAFKVHHAVRQALLYNTPPRSSMDATKYALLSELGCEHIGPAAACIGGGAVW